MGYYKILIVETGATSPAIGDFSVFHEETINCNDIPSIRTELENRYGKFNPKTCQKMYIDINGQPKQIGYIRSFWNRDISHDSKSWWQQDWIEIHKVEEEVVLL